MKHGPRSYKKGASDWTDADYVRYWKSRCVISATGCLEWQGHRTHFMSGRTPIKNAGYAKSTYRGKSVTISRKILEWKLGRPLGPKMQACHTCDVPYCLNDAHLYEGTNRQNHLDGGQRKRMQGQTKTACIHGHEFTPENTIVIQRPLGASSRRCRECFRQKGYRRHWGLPPGAPVPPRQLPIRSRNA